MKEFISPTTGQPIDLADVFRHPRQGREERTAEGRRMRDELPFSKLSFVPQVADRGSALAILREQETTRLQDLLGLRHERMATDSFAYLRGAAAVMAADLAAGPSSRINVQLCGDAHVANFGMYASPERDLVFDLNDFDETLPGPFEWDVKRLAASVVVAGSQAGLKAKHAYRAALAAAETYREAMAALSDMPTLDVWYARLEFDELMGKIKKTALAKAAGKAGEKSKTRTRDSAIEKLTEVVDGKRRFLEQPPELVRVKSDLDGDGIDDLPTLYGKYLNTLVSDRVALLLRFSYLDLAHKVVGVGSVGTRALVLLLESGDGQPLILQIKEADASVLEKHLKPSIYSEHGRRVVSGQRVMQAVSDPFLGWTSVDGDEQLHFYVRQLRDMKGSIETVGLDADALLTYARICGGVLARAHARGGDPSLISGYLGDTDEFDQAVAQFAVDYANIADHDHAELVSWMADEAKSNS